MLRRVYFYSRTGTCAQVANNYIKDGAGYKVQVMDMPENRYSGFWGLIKGLANALTKKNVSYSLVGDKYTKSDQISELVFITPVWADNIPPTFRTFLLNESFNSNITVRVVTVSQSGEGRKVFHQVVDILQKAGVKEIRHKNLRSAEILKED